MQASRLPHGLIDLVFAPTQVTSRKRGLSILGIALHSRLAHSAIAPQANGSIPVSLSQDRSLYSPLYAQRATKERTLSPFARPTPRTPLTTLEERVSALKNAIATEETAMEASSYTEEELISLYENLLAIPPSAPPKTRENPQESEDKCIPTVQSLASRLLEDDYAEGEVPASSQSLAERLRMLRWSLGAGTSPSLTGQPLQEGEDSTPIPLHVTLISRIGELVKSMEDLRSIPIQDANTIETTSMPIGFMVEEEWKALTQYCLLHRDPASAEHVVDLMQRSGSQIPEESLNALLAYYADGADIEQADRIVQKYMTESPTDTQRDLHIKAHVKATPRSEFPSRALGVLHQYEIRALPAPQRAYNKLIGHLFSNNAAISHAHAWDLFAHMRYVAHPEPDAIMYATMIRACASPSLSSKGEPERALDLFHEMVIDKRIPPTPDAYVAVILACARSGDKVYVQEAFRLAKQMLDAHRDARGNSHFAPDKRLYRALLEGSKRLADLPRTRWILAELVREHRKRLERGDPDADQLAVDEGIMIHVFHAYAAYRPPFQRTQTVVVDGEKIASTGLNEHQREASVKQENMQNNTDITIPRRNFSTLPPQTHAEVVYEADALFARIHGRGQEDDIPAKSFEHVQLTTRLTNAYLSVYYKHASLEQAFELFSSLFTSSGVPRNAISYVEALERCAYPLKFERKLALQYAEEIWKGWESVETVWRLRGEHPVAATTNSRHVERTYTAMIRAYALNRQLDRALDLVRQFVRYYPPVAIREPQPKTALRSARTALVGERPLIRLSSGADIPDDAVPPCLSFSEINPLHSRLVAANRAHDIAFLTWMCKSYEGSLRLRRVRSLKSSINTEKSVAVSNHAAGESQ